MAAARSRPLRVLITADAVGGVWTHVESLVRSRGLLAAGARDEGGRIEYTVAVLGPQPPRPSAAMRCTPVHHLPGRLEWMEAPWADVRASAAWLRELADAVQPDVVHVNGFAPAASGFAAPVLMGVHSCVCSWWRAVHGTAAPPEWNTYRRMVRRGVQAASLVVAPTAAMLRLFEAEHGRVAHSMVIHNGGPALRSSGESVPAIVSVGRFWDEAKNLRVLDAVAPRLPWPITVLGPIDGPSGLAHRPRHVRALGPQPAAVVRQWLQRARIYAHPARYEPFGLAVLEAAQAGCALVLADLPSLREVWGTAAVYVTPDDDRAWADTLRALIDAPARLDALATAARRTARHYPATVMAHRYQRAYAQLCGHARRPVAAPAPGWGLQPGAIS